MNHAARAEFPVLEDRQSGKSNNVEARCLGPRTVPIGPDAMMAGCSAPQGSAPSAKVITP